MTQEDKELLLKDLCARLPYKVMCACGKFDAQLKLVCPDGDYCVLQHSPYEIETVKPYLRPMSSMTEKEKKEAKENGCIIYWDTSPEDKGLMVIASQKGFDWLNKNMFDYRGLIPMNLAIEAPEGMHKK
jgi:hypothetical protein